MIIDLRLKQSIPFCCSICLLMFCFDIYSLSYVLNHKHMTSKAKLLMLNCCYTNIDTYNGILSSYCVKIFKNIINTHNTHNNVSERQSNFRFHSAKLH